MDRYMVKPDKLAMVAWTFISIGINTASIFIVYYECAFHLRAVKETSISIMAIEFILAADIILQFFKAFPGRESNRGWICTLLGWCGFCKTRCLL
mmetsp:Transcript_1164/g.1537  ORF Transcript_1164/g.1537 Transcript_1164/m.1537 type:complete len:95 (-) Transcript_1164:109-393(-)